MGCLTWRIKRVDVTAVLSSSIAPLGPITPAASYTGAAAPSTRRAFRSARLLSRRTKIVNFGWTKKSANNIATPSTTKIKIEMHA